MNAFLIHPLRASSRLLWLAAELSLAAARRPFVARERAARARWLRTTCRRLLRVFNVELDTGGPSPEAGLLVSNHLGYLDIVVLGALAPCVFVSKSEVARWPVFGWFARHSGTLFVRRDQRADTARLNQEIKTALSDDVLVVLFPEGTSSDGQTVLPFRSALLEPVAGTGAQISAARIRYELSDGDPAAEVCYWRDMTLAPHLLNLLGKERVRASVRFTRPEVGHSDRKTLARQLHAEVLKLDLGSPPLCPA